LLLMGFQLILVSQAAEIESTRSFDRMAEFIPAFLQRGVGSSALVLATFKGTVSFGYFHPVIVVLVSMLTMYVAAEPAHEVESGLVDLVLARSIPRRRLITRSLLLTIAVPLAAATMMAAGTWIGLHAFATPDWDWPTPAIVGKLLVHLVAVAWCLGGLSLAVAAGARRWSKAYASVALTAVALYLLDLLSIGWAPARLAAWISPFRYYPALPIVAGTPVSARNIVVLVSGAVALVVIAYWRFEKRDL